MKAKFANWLLNILVEEYSDLGQTVGNYQIRLQQYEEELRFINDAIRLHKAEIENKLSWLAELGFAVRDLNDVLSSSEVSDASLARSRHISDLTWWEPKKHAQVLID